MESFGKLYGDDADHLAEMFAAFPSRVRERYTAMTLHLWSHLKSKDGADPYVATGRRTLARECDVTERTAQCYFEFMEREGFLETVGTKKGSGGQYTIRSFWWHVGRGERPHVQRVNVGAGSDVPRVERGTSVSRSISETESQNSGEAARAAIAARFAERERMWGDGE